MYLLLGKWEVAGEGERAGEPCADLGTRVKPLLSICSCVFGELGRCERRAQCEGLGQSLTILFLCPCGQPLLMGRAD